MGTAADRPSAGAATERGHGIASDSPALDPNTAALRPRVEGSGALEGTRILLAVALAIGAGCGAVLLSVTPLVEAVRECLHLTAATSAVLLILVLPGSALRRRWPTPLTRYLLRNRRQLGLSVAVSHLGFHGGFIVLIYALGAGSETPLTTVVGGGFGMACLAAMAATSTDAAQRRLGHNWRRLHLFCLYSSWTIFAISYLGGALTGRARAIAITTGLVASLALRWLPPQSGRSTP